MDECQVESDLEFQSKHVRDGEKDFKRTRTFLVDEQRKMAETGNVILDGRDIGTVVLPHADLKLYQIASVETRAKRRYLENKERGLEADLETIKKDA